MEVKSLRPSGGQVENGRGSESSVMYEGSGGICGKYVLETAGNKH